TTNASVLIDGVVEGVEYLTTSGMSGLTNQEGLFNYQDGDDITFKVGGVVLGTATAEDVTSGRTFLQDIADVERSNLADDYLQNMAVFLQSLDQNHDASDGIVISEAVRDALGDMELDLRTATEAEVQQLVESVGGIYVSEQQAMEHVQEMLIEYGELEAEDFDTYEQDVLDTSNVSAALSTSGAIDVDQLANDFVSNSSAGSSDGVDLSQGASVVTTELLLEGENTTTMDHLLTELGLEPRSKEVDIVQDQVEAEHANAINTFPQTPATLGFPFGSDQLHTD
ncbi:MAG: hypothetical protein GY905_12415, partial [Gammaproteobacteria bacterium]|nr:hypothetical protein [Gammaproteobacteria bacterium]